MSLTRALLPQSFGYALYSDQLFHFEGNPIKAEIISIGTELMMGELTDTNASFIASRLPALGIDLQWVTQVGDELSMLAEALSRGLTRSDIIFTSGGLGPTQDDLTREAIARALGEEITVRDDLLVHLKAFFIEREMDMPDNNIKQATIIPSAEPITNRRGTAPGWWVERRHEDTVRTIVAMPGPPGELRGIWEEEVVPWLGRSSYTSLRGTVILTRTLKTNGLTEGGVDEMVSAYLGKENPYLGIYAKPDGIHLRIIARAANVEDAGKLISTVEQGITSAVGRYVWGYDEETPEATAGTLLAQKNLTLATMEACTGGLLASRISEAKDSTAYYKGGVVVDDSGSASGSGVSTEVIKKHGMASPEVAEAMARAAQDRFQADIGIGLTGAPGPNNVGDKPAGSVNIAIAAPQPSVHHFALRLPPRRALVKQRAVSTALIELRRILEAL